jgi:hypothetical protein
VKASETKPRLVPRAHRGKRAAILWCGVGFLAGAAFWHAVGFWGFVSNVVLTGAGEVKTELAVAEAPKQVVEREAADERLPTIYLVDPARCTALAIDRGLNRTVVRPCPSQGLALRLEPLSSREDLSAALSVPTVQPAGYRTRH